MPEAPLSPEQDLALSMAESLKYGLRCGSKKDYDWLFTPEFDRWVDVWREAAQLPTIEEVSPEIVRRKLIETCWKG